MKPIVVITIISGRPEDNGRRIRLGLFKSSGLFRWFGGNPGESPAPISGQDSEVSGPTIELACRAARKAWAGSAWDLKSKSSLF